MERDAATGEAGLDHTWFRKYSPSQGRFCSADRLSGNVLDPQSLNRYVYALNDPVNRTDRTGLDSNCEWKWDEGSSTGILTCSTGSGGEDLANDPLGDVVCWMFGYCGGQDDGPPDIPPGPPPGGIINFPDPTVQPPPPPGYEECMQSLGSNGSKALARATSDWGSIREAANKYGVDPGLIAAIGIHESGWINRPEIGGGLGRGVFQIDIGQHPGAASTAGNTALAANYVAGMLARDFGNFYRRGYDVSTSVALAVRAYNSGPDVSKVASLLSTGYFGYINVNTTTQYDHGPRQYVDTVLAIAKYCF